MNSNSRKKAGTRARPAAELPSQEPTPAGSEPMEEDPQPVQAGMTLEQALDHYKKTVEDVHRKKVNKLNAFNYRMTEYLMNVFTSFQDRPQQETVKWETYGEGIDVCSEVYGYCVDFVHMSTNRLMNGLHRVHGEPEEEEKEVEAEDKDQEEKPKDRKRKKQLQDGLSTLDTPENLQSKTIERGYEMDPFYAKMSACFDAGKSEGILLNNLKVNEGLELLLYSKETMECPFTQPFGVFTQPCFPGLTVETLEGEKLCRELEEFEGRFITGNETRPSNFHELIQAIGGEMDEQSDGPDQIDDGAIYHETFENTIPDTELPSNPAEPRFQRRSQTLDESLTHLSHLNDFHFFTAKPATWAGLEYWNRNVGAVTTRRSEKKSRKKEVPTFEFNPEGKEDTKALFGGESKDHVIRPKSIETMVAAEYTLPTDYQVTIRRFTQTFSKPNTQVKIFRRDDQSDPIEENVIVQNYSQDDADLPDGGEDGNELYAREEELKEVPVTQTREDQLQFSKVSKRVDIRLLKEEMWKNMGAGLGRSVLGSENRTLRSREDSLLKTDPSSGQPTFMQIVRSLPERLPQHELENLSIHSCFITMLHLANEKNLSLEAIGDCDFRIALRDS